MWQPVLLEIFCKQMAFVGFGSFALQITSHGRLNGNRILILSSIFSSFLTLLMGTLYHRFSIIAAWCSTKALRRRLLVITIETKHFPQFSPCRFIEIAQQSVYINSDMVNQALCFFTTFNTMEMVLDFAVDLSAVFNADAWMQSIQKLCIKVHRLNLHVEFSFLQFVKSSLSKCFSVIIIIFFFLLVFSGTYFFCVNLQNNDIQFFHRDSPRIMPMCVYMLVCVYVFWWMCVH